MNKSLSEHPVSSFNLHIALLSSPVIMPGFQSGQEENGGVMLNAKATERTTLLYLSNNVPTGKRNCFGGLIILSFCIHFLFIIYLVLVCLCVWSSVRMCEQTYHDMNVGSEGSPECQSLPLTLF